MWAAMRIEKPPATRYRKDQSGRKADQRKRLDNFLNSLRKITKEDNWMGDSKRKVEVQLTEPKPPSIRTRGR